MNRLPMDSVEPPARVGSAAGVGEPARLEPRIHVAAIRRHRRAVLRERELREPDAAKQHAPPRRGRTTRAVACRQSSTKSRIDRAIRVWTWTIGSRPISTPASAKGSQLGPCDDAPGEHEQQHRDRRRETEEERALRQPPRHERRVPLHVREAARAPPSDGSPSYARGCAAISPGKVVQRPSHDGHARAGVGDDVLQRALRRGEPVARARVGEKRR